PMAAPASAVTTPAWAVAPPPPPPPLAPPLAPPLGPQRPRSPRRRTGVLVGVGILVLAIITGGLTVWLLNRGDDDNGPSADRAGGLNVMPASIDNGVSVLGEPGRTWEFSPTDVTSDSSIGSMSPDGVSNTDTVLSFPETFVFQTGREDEDAPAQLVGVDRDSGDVRWTHDLASYGSACFLPDADHLYCSVTTNDDGHGELVRIDPAKGKVTATAAVDTTWLSMVLDNGLLYVVHSTPGDAEGHSVTLRTFDADTLREAWELQLLDRDARPADGDEYDYGPWIEFQGGRLSAYHGPLQWEIDHRARRVTSYDSSRDWNTVTSEDGYTLRWIDDGTVQITDGSGREVLRSADDPWYGGAAGNYVAEGRLGIGSGLFDLSSGEYVWKREDLAGYDDQGSEFDWRWTLDRRNVLVEDSSYDETLERTSGNLLDGETGKTLVHLPEVNAPTVRTRDAIVTMQEGEVRAYDAATGDLAWTRSLPGSYDSLYLAGDSIVAVGSYGFFVLTDFPSTRQADSDQRDGDTAYVTACGAPPEFVPTASTTRFGGVAITYTVKATCDGGQWLNHSQLSVPFVVGGYAYASGYFDFSEEPYWIPEEGEDLELVYPFENTQVPETRFEQAIQEDGGTGKVIEVPCEPGPDNTEGAVPSDPSYGADPDDPTTADGAPDESTDEDRDETALEALQRIADEDAGAVDALGTSWTAQLSSKKPGTADDGKVYDSYDDILALHLQHRARYPDSLLVYSNDWSGSFGPSSRDYWVTLSGQSEATSRPVLRWCQDEGWGLGDCWAKRLQHSGDPDLNTDKNEPDDRNN
ncbi:PQQ-binding-like beta-propeller repeat protein, partial [Nocardioides sp. GCM10030258]|uniref:outer membrane protein assembly factor BamB family protein n=1 Tax=unclassified Nocardioides TaxID=2615069 RepID=UPI003611B919